MVQHIFTGQYARYSSEYNSIDLAFTQEWPLFGQRSQLSYTLPYGRHPTYKGDKFGVGDIFLNYRYQVYLNETSLTAFAPRISLVLPTGDYFAGNGTGLWGVQMNLPYSTTLSDEIFLHLNVGATYYPQDTMRRSRPIMNAGASVIYCILSNFNPMIEWIIVEEQEPLISPGIRYAFNFDSGAQLVIGAAAPMAMFYSSPKSVLLYLSYEHGF